MIIVVTYFFNGANLGIILNIPKFFTIF